MEKIKFALATSALLHLPEELHREIWRKLRSADVISTALVCRQFAHLASHQDVWNHLCKSRWPISSPFHSVDWKLYYREKTAIASIKWTSLPVRTSSECVQPPPRQSHGCAAVGEKMVILGGHVAQGDTFIRKDDIWVYHTSTDHFEEITTVGLKPPQISRHRMVSVDGLIYSFAGILQDKTKLNSVFTLDFHKKEWKELTVFGTKPSPRCDPVVVTRNSQIIVFGGSDKDMNFLSDVHVFDTNTLTWQQPQITGVAPSTRIGSVGGIIQDKLYLYGGGNYDRVRKVYTQMFAEIWTLNLTTWHWEFEVTSGTPPTACDFLNIFTLGNHFFIDGGWHTKPWCYDTVTKTWMQINSSNPQNNNDSSCVVVGNTAVYYGGYFNHYCHHLMMVDLSPLSFLQA